MAYERNDFLTATDFYGRVSGDSAYYADVLFELVWTFIKQDKYDRALEAVELFLLAYPEHRYTGELRVLQGHLHMGCGQTPEKCPSPTIDLTGAEPIDAFDQALAAYETIVVDYTPLKDRFQGLADSDDEPKLYFEQVLHLDDDSSATGIPEFALAMMRDDVELSDALDVYGTVQQQKSDLAVAEGLVGELELLLSGDAALGGYDSARFEVVRNQNRAMTQKLALLELERVWLVDEDMVGNTAFTSDIDEIRAIVREESNSASKTQGEKTEAEKRVEALRQEIGDVEGDAQAVEAQIATLRSSLTGETELSESKRAEINSELADLEKKLKMTMGTLQASSAQLMGLHTAVDQVKAQTAQVGQIATTAKATAEASADGVLGVEEQVAALMQNLAASKKPARKSPRKKTTPKSRTTRAAKD